MKKLFHPDIMHAIAFIIGLITVAIVAQDTSFYAVAMISASIGCTYLAAFGKAYLEGFKDGTDKAYKSITGILDKAIKNKQQS